MLPTDDDEATTTRAAPTHREGFVRRASVSGGEFVGVCVPVSVLVHQREGERESEQEHMRSRRDKRCEFVWRTQVCTLRWDRLWRLMCGTCDTVSTRMSALAQGKSAFDIIHVVIDRIRWESVFACSVEFQERLDRLERVKAKTARRLNGKSTCRRGNTPRARTHSRTHTRASARAREIVVVVGVVAVSESSKSSSLLATVRSRERERPRMCVLANEVHVRTRVSARPPHRIESYTCARSHT